jgi:hypothetical protein
LRIVKGYVFYPSTLIKIHSQNLRYLREGHSQQVIRMCKVQWRQHLEDEATWEREDDIKEEFP